MLRVSADALEDTATGLPYYAAELAITDEARAELGDIPLMAALLHKSSEGFIS